MRESQMRESQMRESQIEREFVAYAKGKGCMCIKLTSEHHKGLPDRLVLLPKGKLFFVEFKAPGKSPTPQQERVHNKLKGLQQPVLCFDDIENSKRVLNWFLKQEK